MRFDFFATVGSTPFPGLRRTLDSFRIQASRFPGSVYGLRRVFPFQSNNSYVPPSAIQALTRSLAHSIEFRALGSKVRLHYGPYWQHWNHGLVFDRRRHPSSNRFPVISRHRQLVTGKLGQRSDEVNIGWSMANMALRAAKRSKQTSRRPMLNQCWRLTIN